MVRPEWRKRGLAESIIRNTLPMVGVPYIECVTFTESIERLLVKCGFRSYGRTGGVGCEYYLWNQLQTDGHRA